MSVLPIGMSGEEGLYQIERSLRFNSSDSSYMSRTPASAGNRKTWTWSGWVKRGLLGSYQVLFGAGASTSNRLCIRLDLDTLAVFEIGGGSTVDNVVTSAVFRDPSAWYHVTVAYNSTEATASNRVKIYVNGIQQTNLSSADYPTLDYNGYVNLNASHFIGMSAGSTQYFDGYLAEVHFIDGSALTPSSFGETDTDTGVWQPKAYSGSYGTNGFYLDFNDNSSTTALGYDAAGSNDWTPNNFSVTAGAGNDSLVDSPTRYGTDTGVGGEVRGNYATFNPLGTNNNATFANGNLDTVSGSGASTVGTTFGMTTGKWYAEFVCTAKTSVNMYVAIVRADTFDGDNQADEGTNIGYLYLNTGLIYHGFASESYGASWAVGDVIGVAFDADTRYVTFYVNGSSQGAYTRIASENAAGFTWLMAVGEGQASATASFTMNAGQRPFAYTAPSGFKALCTTNLPEPTIAEGGEYFNTVLYTGNGSTQSITGVGFQPDLVWGKSRSNAYSNRVFDSVRGATLGLNTNGTNAEFTESGVTSFDSDGFSLGSGTNTNGSGATFVAWNWKANGAGVSNTAGTISSTVSANTTAGFSIVTYTGNGTAGATVGHGLGVAPKMIFGKNRTSGTPGWPVYHASVGNTGALILNSTSATDTSSAYWNNTSPTSSVFSIGTGTSVNTSTQNYVFYCFAEVPGYSAFGSYTGNGSTDGPFVFTGFRPKFVLVKRSSAAGSWGILDSTRSPENAVNETLYPNLSNAESTATDECDFLSNGFKLRSTGSISNDSGATHIYAAFAESPFSLALAR